MDEQAIRELLLQESEEFRNLYEEHQRCERQLAELSRRNFLSEDDRLKEKELKKKKLLLKDEMYRMIIDYGRRMRGDE